MRKRWSLVAILLVALASPALADKRSDAKDLVSFGMSLAQRNLWKEAVTRFERAVKLDPEYGAAWNDLAIGYEQLGKFAEARTAYEKAMEMDVNNQFIRSNYEQFREIYDRQNRRRIR